MAFCASTRKELICLQKSNLCIYVVSNPGDAIVAAGDLAAAKQLWPLGNAVDEWLAAHILYVLGNLEFYGNDIDEVGQIFELQYLLLHGTLLWVFVLIVVVITSRA